jgi:hypothetical protein
MVRLKAGRESRPQLKDYTFILTRQKKRVQTDRFAAQRSAPPARTAFARVGVDGAVGASFAESLGSDHAMSM